MSRKDIVFLKTSFENLRECKKERLHIAAESYYGKILGYVRCLEYNDIIDYNMARKIIDIAINISSYGSALKPNKTA